MVQVSPVAIGKMEEIEKRFQAPAEFVAHPEALETRGTSLSEGTAGPHICWELQYSSFFFCKLHVY